MSRDTPTVPQGENSEAIQSASEFWTVDAEGEASPLTITALTEITLKKGDVTLGLLPSGSAVKVSRGAGEGHFLVADGAFLSLPVFALDTVQVEPVDAQATLYFFITSL